MFIFFPLFWMPIVLDFKKQTVGYLNLKITATIIPRADEKQKHYA